MGYGVRADEMRHVPRIASCSPSSCTAGCSAVQLPNNIATYARGLLNGVIQRTINTVNLINPADVIARLSRADNFEEEVRVVVGKFLPGEGIAWSRVIRGQRGVEIAIQVDAIAGEIICAQLHADDGTIEHIWLEG